MWIYVLKLNRNKYYVGKTSNPKFRLKDHFREIGSSWTRKYKPLQIQELIPDCDDYDEDKWTIKYMKKYGIDNVRGGSFNTLKLDETKKNVIQHMITSSDDRCYKCKKTGHFVSDCTYEESSSIDETDSDYEEEQLYLLDGNKKLLRYEGKWWEESPHCNTGARDGTVFIGGIGTNSDYYRPYKISKTKTSGNCYRCGRSGHYSNNCFAKKHIKGYWLSR